MAKPKGGKPQEKKAITSDSRFASVHNDPRFRLPNLKHTKVKVDERFSKKELAKLNSTATGKKVKIDRYGRKLKDKDPAEDLQKYYEYEEEENEELSGSGSGSDSGSDSDSESDNESDNESDSEDSGAEAKQVSAKAKKPKKDEFNKDEGDDDVNSAEGQTLDRARGEGLSSSSDDDSASGLDSSSGSESEDESEEDSEIELEDSKPAEGDPSDSFAVVNMDWDNLKAVDLMATFMSFVPTGGSIKSVRIFPSEFGKEQMQKEEIEGPPKDLFRKKSKKQDLDSDNDSDDDLDLNNPDDLERAARKLYEEDDGEEDYDSKALRRYQLQRLRYYYAVVKCDSVKTAKNIYDNCDGTEYESTANIFDLRYVPEDMEFEEDDTKDVCTKIPATYKPNSTFVTDALQHSKVKLTWDETPKERLTLSSKQFSQKEIDEMDFKAYLASDSGESSDEERGENARDKYKSLLGGSFGFGKKKADNLDDDDDDDDVDMEITFDPGLDEDKEKKEKEIQLAKEQEESTIAAYRRKEKERRQRRMEKFKQDKQAAREEKEQAAEPKKKDSSEKKGKDKNNKKSKPLGDDDVDAKRKAELELIMMDDKDDAPKSDHFNMRDIIKSEKAKGKKGKKTKKNIDTELTQDKFEADLNDPRFKEIFESHSYAIDPTSSEYKKTDTMQKIMKERSKRHRFDGSDNASKKQKVDNNANDKIELSSLVNKLKRKGGKK